MKFATSASAFVLFLASVASAATVAQLSADVKAIEASVGSLNQHLHVQQLNEFNGMAIRSAAQDVIAKMDATSADLKELDGKPTNEDAKAFLTMLGNTELKVKSAIKNLNGLKGEFKKLGFLSAAQETVNDFKTKTYELSAQLVEVAPAEEQRAAKILAARFNKDLEECAAFYSATGTETQAGGKAGAAEVDAAQPAQK